MTITHREGKIHTNADGLSRNALPNDKNNPASDLQEEENVLPVYGINVVDLSDEFFEIVKKGYGRDENIIKIQKILDGNIENKTLIGTLEKPYRELMDEGRFRLCGEMLYISSNRSCVIVLGDKATQMEVLRMSHDEILSGHLNVERTKERVQKCAWWKGWSKDVEEYVETCDTCQRANKKTGKRLGLLQKIKDPTYPWEIINMDFVTGLPPAGDKGYNTCLVVVDRLSRRSRFIPAHKEVDAQGCALLFWKTIISKHGLPRIIISDRDPKFTAEIWKSLFNIMGTKLAL